MRVALAPILGEMPLVRRLRERWIVPLGYLITAGTTLAIPYIANLPWLMVSQALGGLGRGRTFPILMSRSIQAVAPSQRATAMGFFQASYALGMTAGPWMGDLLGAWLGLEGIFVGTAALTTATALVACLWLR